MGSIKRYVQKRSVACRVIEGAAILIVPEQATIQGLNATGTRIWTLLEKPHTEDEILDEVCARFSVSRDAASPDVRSFLADMIRRGLVAEEPAALDDGAP